MIIGGASFYEQMLPRADRLYVTLVHVEVEGDSWFPEFDLSQWTKVECKDCEADEKNPYTYSFLIYERTS
jgi:dihydrofolate reductase